MMAGANKRKPATTSVQEAMRRLKVPAGTIRSLILQGKLRAGGYEAGVPIAVYADDLEDLIANLPAKVKPPSVEKFAFPGAEDWGE